MSVSAADRADGGVDVSISIHLAPELPSDVSVPSGIPSDDSASPVQLKQDASNGHASGTSEPSLPDASTEAHDTAHTHSHTLASDSVPIVYHEEKADHEPEVGSTPALEAGPTTSDSVAAENDLDAAATHANVPMKEMDKTTTNGPDVDATTAEHQEPLTSESAMAIVDTAEESLADKSIGHDSGIEILAPALEQKEGEGKDHVPADKPDIEVAQAASVVESDAAVGVEYTPEDTNHTVEEVTHVEATEATIPVESESVPHSNEGDIPVPEVDANMAPEGNAARAVEEAKLDVVTEDQLQVEVTSEEHAAETSGSEGETKTVRGVEVEQETVHEAKPAAAEINNVEDTNHEAAIDQHQAAQDAPQTTLEANGHEATLQESEEPEVTVHLQEASSIAESPADHVAVDDAVETAEESANGGVAAVQASVELASEEVAVGVASEEVLAPVEPEHVVEVTNEEVQAPSEEAPAVVEVEAVGEERSQAPAADDEVAGKEVPAPTETEAVVAEQIQAPVDAAVAESAAEVVPTHTEIEIVAEPASEGVSAPVEAQPVASDGVAESVEAGHAVEVPVEAEPATEVSGQETSAVVEAEVATSEEVAVPEATTAEVANEDVTAPVEDKPAAEVIEAATSTEVATSVPAPVETESVAEVSVKSEHVVSAATPAETEPANDIGTPVEAEPVAEEPFAAVRSEPVSEEPAEAKTTTGADEDILAPAGAESTISAVSETTTVHEESAPVQEKETPIAADVEPLAEDTALLVSDTEPKVSVQAVLKDQEAPESQAGIRDDTEADVVSKPASVALATCAVEETPSAALSEPAKETNAGELPDSAPTENLSTDVSEPPSETPLVEQPKKDNDAEEVEPLTELNTEPLSIQTSVDTTPFTPIVDSGIELKEQESQPHNLLSIVEEIERPKSHWSPSFQVTTVGQGGLLDDAEEGPVQDNPTASELNDTIKIVDAPILIIEDASGAPAATTSEILSSTDAQSLEPPARSWTPSYSVHLQGSPVQVTKELTEDVPSLNEQHVDEVMPPGDTYESEQVHAEIGSTVEDNEAASEQVAEVVVTQQETGEVSVSGSEVEDVALTNTTKPSTEYTDIPVITVADEGVKKVLESSLQPQERHLSSDAPESSAKLWTPSYSVHAQGSPLQSPKELESGAENIVLAESVEATIDSKAVEGLGNAEAAGVTDVASIAPTVDIENEKLVDEANTTTVQGPANDTALEVSDTPWAPSYSVHAQGTPVVKSVELEVSTSAADVEPPTELPVLSVSTESSENTTPEAPEESWTPSYFVHSQGSSLVPRTELDTEAKVVEPSAEWTPSYSVHSQGSPMVVAKGLDESPEHATLEPPAESYSAHSQGTPLVAPKKLEDIPVHDVAEFEAPIETEAQQITPVSSLVFQADSVAVESRFKNDDTAVPTTDAQDKNTNEDNKAEAILPAIVAPVLSLTSLDTAAENPVAVSEAEGPARPWTSSYSISSPSLDPMTLKDEQPSDNHSRMDETEVHNTQEQISEISTAVEVAEEVQFNDQAALAWIPSYSINVQGTGVEKTETEASSESITYSDVEHSTPVEIDPITSVDKTIPPLLVSGAVSSTESNNAAATDVPERPWTPSYLVTQQGSGLLPQGGKVNKPESSSQPVPEASSVPNDVEPQLNEVHQSNEFNAVQLRPGQAVGSAEDMARNEKFMLFGLRAIVAYLWVLPRWLSMRGSPSESGHSRRESSSSSSSSSSKFFPGGWFSTKPNEGRTSLDTAQGEFAASPKISTSDAFETISADAMYREAGASSSATTVEDGTDGQNRRWCIVM